MTAETDQTGIEGPAIEIPEPAPADVPADEPEETVPPLEDDGIASPAMTTAPLEMLTEKDLAKIPADFDPLDEAERLGTVQYSHPGRIGFPKLQMSYMMMAFQTQTYTDSAARLRMHILLYWRRGFWKTSLIKMFLDKCIPSVNVIEQGAHDPKALTYLECLRFTPARIRGSIAEGGRVVMPLIQRPKILFAGEFLNLFGSGEQFDDAMNLYLQIMEEGRGVVSLAKMVGVEIDEETAERLDSRNIKFDSIDGIMSYTTEGTVLGGCRPLHHFQAQKMEQAGLFDRMFVVHWTPDLKEFNETWEFEPPFLGPEAWETLKLWNTRLWQVKWKNISQPPLESMKVIKRTLSSLYDSYERKHGLNHLNGLRSARDSVNLRQVYTAFAVIDTLQADPYAMEFDDITYTDRAFERTIDFLPEYVRARSFREATDHPGGFTPASKPRDAGGSTVVKKDGWPTTSSKNTSSPSTPKTVDAGTPQGEPRIPLKGER